MNITPTAAAAGSADDDRFRYGRLTLITLTAALGGLLFGYDWVVIGGAKPFFERYFNLTDEHARGWANSCALIGCLVGASSAGVLGNRFGRRWSLRIAALLFAVTSLGNAAAATFTQFTVWRMLGGTAIGLASNLSPLYIAETSPAALRGRLVAVNQLTIVLGILAAQLVNWSLVRHLPTGVDDAWLMQSWYVQSGWRWMFGLTAVPALLFFIGMFAVPESPTWLALHGRSEQARRGLAAVGGDDYARRVLAELADARPTVQRGVDVRRSTPKTSIRLPMLGVVLAVFQQWCGINVIFNYADEIFRSAGYDVSDVLQNITWTGSVNLAFTLVALATVDRLGRRPLMLAGAAGLAIIYTALAVGYSVDLRGTPMLCLVLAAIGCYAMTLAPVTWVVITEIFPARLRDAAVSTAVTALWIACFALTYTFPLLNQRLGAAGTFGLYAGICTGGFVFIWVMLPETKGKSLEAAAEAFPTRRKSSTSNSESSR